MSYTDEQLKKTLLPELKIIAKQLGIPYTKVKKADLIQKIIEKNRVEKTDTEQDELFKKIKKILKKYIKLNLDTVSNNSALKYLSTKITADEYKKVIDRKPDVIKYIKKIHTKYHVPGEDSEEEYKAKNNKNVVFKDLSERDNSDKIDRRFIDTVIRRSKRAIDKYIKENPNANEQNIFDHLSTTVSDNKYKIIEQYKPHLVEYIKKDKANSDKRQVISEDEISEDAISEDEVVKKDIPKDIKNYTVAKLKEHLKNIGVTESLKGKLKSDFLRYAESDRCDPDKGNFCKGEYEVCDIRNNICVFEEDIPSRKGLKKYEYNGYTVYGTDDQLSKIKKGKSVNTISEADITDTMITFIKTSKEKISNIKLFNHIKDTFNLTDSLKKIEEKFYPFLKLLYKDVKQSNIGYNCVDGKCILTKDKNTIKYATIEECSEKCKEKKSYFACDDKVNKCVAVSLDEAEYKTKSECKEYCGVSVQPEPEEPKKHKVIKVKVDEDIYGKKFIVQGDKTITLKDIKELEKKSKLVKEIDDIMTTSILYDNELDKHNLAMMKCLGLILVS